MRILLMSDNHGYIDEQILGYAKGCDEIWHAGDIGSLDVVKQLEEVAPVKAVFGNIDDVDIRNTYLENLAFDCEGLKVWITHIGGYPPKYSKKIKLGLNEIQPGLFICGHSHILKVIPDPTRNLIHMNPGACGHSGFHKVRTMLRFEVSQGIPKKLEVIELGLRGR